MLMIADNAALSLFNTYLSRDVVRSWILKSNECPPNSSYPNPVLYEKGSGMFLFAESFAKGLLKTADEQRQGITVTAVSCLLIFLTEYGILGLTDGNRQRS